MAAKRHKPEEIVTKLRQVEVLVGHPLRDPSVDVFLEQDDNECLGQNDTHGEKAQVALVHRNESYDAGENADLHHWGGDRCAGELPNLFGLRRDHGRQGSLLNWLVDTRLGCVALFEVDTVSNQTDG